MDNGQVNPGTPAATPVAPRRMGAPALVALLVAAAALAASAWLFQEVRRARDDAARQALDVQRSAVRIEALAQELSGLRAGLRQLADDESNLAERLAGVRTALDELARAQGNVDYALAEVEYLLTLAEQRLILMQDPDTAIAALEAAERRLTGLDAPGLDAVRGQLQADLARLRTAPRTDWGGWYRDLGQVAADAATMPARSRTVAEPAPAQSPGGWRGLLHAAWQELRQLVVITRRGEGAALLPGDDAMLAPALQLRVESARVALLRHDAVAAGAAAQEALQFLLRWFDATDPAVRAARGKLEALAAIEPGPELPDITSSLETLRALERERAVPVPVPPADEATGAAPTP